MWMMGLGSGGFRLEEGGVGECRRTVSSGMSVIIISITCISAYLFYHRHLSQSTSSLINLSGLPRELLCQSQAGISINQRSSLRPSRRLAYSDPDRYSFYLIKRF